ncbi:hypothetical protein [Clostridium homopropionicum]|uniref:hypothetical protein n=1 Tax=Clostridium homopropionicum TaxID=36844 RepID=UPI0011145FFF|nr:hypothetical protein [Clostridium homopropionicum]
MKSKLNDVPNRRLPFEKDSRKQITLYSKSNLFFILFYKSERGRASWNGEQIVIKEYLEKALKLCNDLNPAYGYLFWLNELDNGLAPGSIKHFLHRYYDFCSY